MIVIFTLRWMDTTVNDFVRSIGKKKLPIQEQELWQKYVDLDID